MPWPRLLRSTFRSASPPAADGDDDEEGDDGTDAFAAARVWPLSWPSFAGLLPPIGAGRLSGVALVDGDKADAADGSPGARAY